MAPPNVIVITVDGMRWNDLGALGNPDVRTPNLDALAGHGVAFTQAYIDQCPPHDVTTNDRNAKVAPSTNTVCQLATQLNRAGYSCSAVGKTGANPVGFHRTARGDGMTPDDDFGRWKTESSHPSADGSDRTNDKTESHHVVSWIGNQAVRVCQSDDEPFFLWVAFPPTTNTPTRWRDMYATVKFDPADENSEGGDAHLDKSRLITHYGAISQLDRQIGRMLATLTARGRTNNVFVFTATQGMDAHKPHPEDTSRSPFCEATIHVPLIVGGMLGQRRGETDTALVSTADIPATVLDALVPKTSSAPRNGSFLAQLRRAGAPHRRALVIRGEAESRAVRNARYKWIVDRKNDTESLFDLQTDPSERVNLHNTQRALAIRKMLSGLTQD